MSEFLSRPYEGFARVEQSAPRAMVSLRGDLGSQAMAAAVSEVSGCAIPEPLRLTQAAQDDDRGGGQTSGQSGAQHGGQYGAACLWMSPDELLLLGPAGTGPELAARLTEALAGQHHLAVDVSEARALFRVSGPAAREVMMKITPADVARMGPGDARRTRLAQIAGALWMEREAAIEVACFRSVGAYVAELLTTAARSGGEVGLLHPAAT
ncbi:sarcosine oxidase subunit gamma [Mesobaculum littorinae]|uniref:Sarcosine oxidase subunit gamma n=1 Tax=Mesobaculum littorinae TaxID=2486419 RepID=A0A438AJH6_9RHOB|nr:sarcosine oxidase subunit gamma family protein [Mesobaculum littorinae]RVV98765.1 sarcosine oxidase subunit gamma [Mesobaculum littorinae]